MCCYGITSLGTPPPQVVTATSARLCTVDWRKNRCDLIENLPINRLQLKTETPAQAFANASCLGSDVNSLEHHQISDRHIYTRRITTSWWRLNPVIIKNNMRFNIKCPFQSTARTAMLTLLVLRRRQLKLQRCVMVNSTNIVQTNHRNHCTVLNGSAAIQSNAVLLYTHCLYRSPVVTYAHALQQIALSRRL